MTTHSNLIGGSSAARIMACPGSMLAPKVPKPESTYAAEGTFLHDVMEKILLGEIAENEAEVVQFMEPFEYDAQELWDNKIDPALDMLDQLYDLIEDGDVFDWMLPEASYGFKADLEGCFGTVDLLCRAGKKMIVADWKFGDGVEVFAEKNSQMSFYAAAAWEEKPELFEGVEEIIYAIIQPRRGSKPKLKLWPTDVQFISDFRSELAETLVIAKTDNPPYTMGDHCKFCDHKPICSEVNSAVKTLLQHEPNALTPEELGAALEKVPALEQLCKDLNKLGQAYLEEGGSVPGFKLVEKRATRKWDDEDEVKKKLRSMKITQAIGYAEPKVLSPAQMEKSFKKNKKDFAKLDGFITKKSTGLVLAPESDKRPAVETLGESIEQLANVLEAQ